ncbi:MAG: Ppx/GppA phosphatase [Anaeromyxobacteraceae bacterium]|nr:Ppx/GppA phosphatase [Anaeromyxobacteraceae bacterium]
MTVPASGRVAVIDVGTNTVLLTVADRSGTSFRPVVERAEITRLGRGVDRTGRLDASAIAETVAVIARYAAEARSLGAERIAAVATSAARDASNGTEFFEASWAAAGLAPEIIAGGEEARLVHLSAWGDFGAPGSPLAVLDVGGGSSELTWGAGPVPEGRRSFQMGAVRLTERAAPGDPPSAPTTPSVCTARRWAGASSRRWSSGWPPSPPPAGPGFRGWSRSAPT